MPLGWWKCSPWGQVALGQALQQAAGVLRWELMQSSLLGLLEWVAAGLHFDQVAHLPASQQEDQLLEAAGARLQVLQALQVLLVAWVSQQGVLQVLQAGWAVAVPQRALQVLQAAWAVAVPQGVLQVLQAAWAVAVQAAWAVAVSLQGLQVLQVAQTQLGQVASAVPLWLQALQAARTLA